jgi:hypothetical protein
VQRQDITRVTMGLAIMTLITMTLATMALTITDLMVDFPIMAADTTTTAIIIMTVVTTTVVMPVVIMAAGSPAMVEASIPAASAAFTVALSRLEPSTLVEADLVVDTLAAAASVAAVDTEAVADTVKGRISSLALTRYP